MAKSSFNWPDSFATDAAFRAWGLQFSNALAAAGLVKQAVAGAIDWTTVLKPTATNAWAGWEIWGLSDALQPTYPVYIKVYYGTAGTATMPVVTVYAGFGFDGAGNLVGNNFGMQVLVVTSSAGSYATYVAGDTSGVVAHLLDGRASYNSSVGTFAIERTRDAGGNLDARGVYIVRAGTSGSVSNNSCFVPRTGNAISYVGTNCVPPASGSGADGATVNLYPVRVMAKAEQTPMTLVMGYFAVDLTAGNPLAITRWDGQVKTFLPLTDVRDFKVPSMAVANPTFAAIYWE